jgi:hypothetical protein
MANIGTYPPGLCRGNARGQVQTRTAQTEQAYRDRYQGLAKAWSRRFDEWQLNPAELVLAVATDLSRRAATYEKSSLKLYHAAIRQHLRDLFDEDLISTEQIERIDGLMLRKPEPDKARQHRRSKKTSARRAKSVKPETLSVLVAVLLEHPTAIRRIAAAQLERGVELATRPAEFLAMRETTPGVFCVPSAKYSVSNERGLVPFRTLPIDDYTSADITELRDIIALIAVEFANGSTLYHIQRRCQRAIREARKALRSKRKVTAYTTRHQARANLTAMGMTAEELAVVMGHASARTAQACYAPARQAWRGMSRLRPPTVDPELVARVRPDTRARPWHGPNSSADGPQPPGV